MSNEQTFDLSQSLIRIAAKLFRGEYMPGLSDFPEDMPKSTPASVRRAIRKAYAVQADLGAEIKSIADAVARMRT